MTATTPDDIVSHTASLPGGYTARFSWDGVSRGSKVEWTPHEPSAGDMSESQFRRFWTRYVAERHAAHVEIAKRIGGPVMCIDLGPGGAATVMLSHPDGRLEEMTA